MLAGTPTPLHVPVEPPPPGGGSQSREAGMEYVIETTWRDGRVTYRRVETENNKSEALQFARDQAARFAQNPNVIDTRMI